MSKGHSYLEARWTAAEMRQLIQIVIIFVAACIETDIYLPAFPDMMNAFHVTEAEIQAILTWNFIGLCLAGPFYGPLSDSMGRRKPLFIALGLFLLGSLVTVFASDFSWLLFGRVLQGLGSGGCFTLGSAIIFDAFSQKKALVALNHLNTIIPLAMAVAPLAGGFLNKHFGFRANFIAITVVVFLSWIVSLASFRETLPEDQRKPLQLRKLGEDFGRVFRSFAFWQMNLPVCLLFGGYLAFLSISAVLFVVEFQVPKTVYPYFQAAVLGGWLVASLSSHWFLKKWGATHAKKVGITILGLSFICFQMACSIAPRNPYWMTLFMVTYSFGYNWVQTPYFGEIMGLMPDIKGILGSIVTSCRLLLTAGVVAIVGHFYDKSITSYSAALWGIALIVAPMIWLRERNHTKRTFVEDPVAVIH